MTFNETRSCPLGVHRDRQQDRALRGHGPRTVSGHEAAQERGSHWHGFKFLGGERAVLLIIAPNGGRHNVYPQNKQIAIWSDSGILFSSEHE